MALILNSKRKLKKILSSKITLGYLGLMGFFLVYLIWPSPPIPELGEKFPLGPGFISDIIGEPIGTFYTNLEKDQIVSFYLEGYSNSPLLNLPLPTKAIEHRPEYASEIINDMHNAKNTSFLIEINQPFRESIIIKGYGEISLTERKENNKKETKKFTPREGETYFLKITPYQIKPHLWQKILSWLIYLVIIPLAAVFFWQRIKEAGEVVKSIFRKKK